MSAAGLNAPLTLLVCSVQQQQQLSLKSDPSMLARQLAYMRCSCPTCTPRDGVSRSWDGGFWVAMPAPKTPLVKALRCVAGQTLGSQLWKKNKGNTLRAPLSHSRFAPKTQDWSL